MPHLKIWAPYALFGLPLFGFALASAIAGPWWFWFIVVLLFFLMRGFFVGLIQVALRPRQQMCIAIEERGVGFGDQQPDRWVFTDGILRFFRSGPDIWTLYHYNGTVLNIPADVISSDDVAFLQSQARAAP